MLLKGRGSFDLPQGHYRVEAYRGLFYTPASARVRSESRRVADGFAEARGLDGRRIEGVDLRR